MPLLLILLQILKFILLFFLFVTVIFLFVPFYYKVRAAKEEAVNVLMIVTWLFGIIYVEYNKKADKSRLRLKLFGIKLLGYRRKNRSAAETPPESDANAKNNAAQADKESEGGFSGDGQQSMKSAPVPEKEKPMAGTEIGSSAKEKRKAKKAEQSKLEESDDSAEDGENNAEKVGIFERISGLKQKFDAFYNHPDRKRIIELTKQLLKRLLRAMKPRVLSFDATVGLPQPDLVGYILAAAGLVKGVSGFDIMVKGVFDRKVLHFGAYADGRLYMYRFTFPIVRYIFAKPIWKLIKPLIFKKERSNENE